MYRFLIFILFLLPVAIFAQPTQNVNPNGYNKFYYENGKISSEGTMRDGKPDGYWKTYSENGKISRKEVVKISSWIVSGDSITNKENSLLNSIIKKGKKMA